MPDTFPSRRQLIAGVVAIALLATLGLRAVQTRAAEECRSALSQATTSYKVEKVLRSETCVEAHEGVVGS
jgi:hypothetical protein